jgi:hypothetical protein
VAELGSEFFFFPGLTRGHFSHLCLIFFLFNAFLLFFRAERGRRRGCDLGSTLASCWVRRQWRSQQLQFGAGLAAWKNSDGVVVEASSLGSGLV